MKISVFGSGNIGGTLGKKWAAAGHEIIFGTRDPSADKVARLLAACAGRGTAVAIADAVVAADMLLLAIPGSAIPAFANTYSAQLAGKIVIDATNNIRAAVMHSLASLQENAPSAQLFRAFSNLGWENFENPVIQGQQVDLFYCGQAGDSQPIVDGLIADIGLNPVYIGDLEQAAVIDSLTRLWFTLALQQERGRHLALKMLHD